MKKVIISAALIMILIFGSIATALPIQKSKLMDNNSDDVPIWDA